MITADSTTDSRSCNVPANSAVAIGDYDGYTGAVEILLNPPGSSAHYVLDITGYFI